MLKRAMFIYRKHKAETSCMVRYLIIGGWNTLFGTGIYAALFVMLHTRVNYLVLMIPANILAITNAYLGYKIFVFKTKGNYIREYLRCYVIYGSSIAVSFVLMYMLVSILNLHPIPAQFLCVVITIIFSYIGHRNFSFYKKEIVKI
jgi:putative flippase GtrA